MADLLDGIVYASIMATFATLKDECKNRDDCIDCPFKTNYCMCLFDTVPEEYDLTKISEALKSNNAPDEYLRINTKPPSNWWSGENNNAYGLMRLELIRGGRSLESSFAKQTVISTPYLHIIPY